jgi:hypothetical protein
MKQVICCVPAGSGWRLWSCARPKYDNNTRYQFLCYTKDTPAAPPSSSSSSRVQDVVGQPPVLPRGIASKHDEYQVCIQQLLLLFDG